MQANRSFSKHLTGLVAVCFLHPGSMYLVYIDEVKYEKKQEPYYWLCGLAIPGESIISVEEALSSIAEDYFGTRLLDPKTEFHASHIVHGKGPFKGHALDQRVGLFQRLADVIDSHEDIERIQVRLDPSRISRSDHDTIAFMYLVERVDMLMRRRNSMALLIADHDKELVNANVRSLSTYKAEGTDFEFGREIKYVVDTVHHTHSHHSRLIQLADLYAYSMSICAKRELSYPRSKLVQYVQGLQNFSFPSTYKHWPPG